MTRKTIEPKVRYLVILNVDILIKHFLQIVVSKMQRCIH